MARLIDANGDPGRGPQVSSDAYGALLRAIVNQQLSTRSARAIYDRILARFGGQPPAPQQILDDDPDELRVAVGLSHAKVGYLRSLAEHVVSGELDLDRLHDLPDDEVTARLVAVKGIGPWSAQVFLMFNLGRPDVLAVGDLGLRQAAQRAYELPAPPTAAEFIAIAEPWRPYRTTGCLVLWHSLRNAPI